MRALWILYWSEFKGLLEVMLCVSLCLCVCVSKAWCMGATRRMHRIHAVCVVKGVWNSCCETQRSSLLCPGSLWSDNCLSTLPFFYFFFQLSFFSYPLFAHLLSFVLTLYVKTTLLMKNEPSVCNTCKEQYTC